jgi:hypothetical protein
LGKEKIVSRRHHGQATVDARADWLPRGDAPETSSGWEDTLSGALERRFELV